MTPRVTFENEIILDLLVESSTLGDNQTVGGQSLPSFGARRVNTRLRLRDGESNLLAGLLREDERRTLRGLPGLLRLPILRSIFASNETDVAQTDIVMLLTPRIVRTHELTQTDVSPIYIGTQQALGLGGPPPLIAAQPETAPPPAPVAAQPTGPALPAGSSAVPQPPPGSSPIPGTVASPGTPAGTSPGLVSPTQPPPITTGTGPVGTPTPTQPPPAQPGTPPAGTPPPLQTQPPPDAPPAPQQTDPAAPPAAAGAGGGQIFLSPPGTDFRVGGGPYTVPVSITGASMVSGATLTITFNPSALRVRAIQEGSFMRSGGVNATFTQQVDAAGGRIDIAVVRAGDTTGVSGTGLMAAILFDAVGGGAANLTLTGAGTGPRGTPVPLVFAPVPMVTVR
jgi:general secretion pathway protein D